jgi:hypothetical protein
MRLTFKNSSLLFLFAIFLTSCLSNINRDNPDTDKFFVVTEECFVGLSVGQENYRKVLHCEYYQVLGTIEDAGQKYHTIKIDGTAYFINDKYGHITWGTANINFICEQSKKPKKQLITEVKKETVTQAQNFNQRDWLNKQVEEYEGKVVVVLEDTNLQRIKGDNSYSNLVGVSKNDILFVTEEDADSYKTLNGYISKSKSKFYSTMEEAEAYVKNQRALATKKAKEAEAKKAATAKAEQDKKAALAKAEQDKKAQACVDSGAVVIINNWAWGQSFGDNVSVEGIITNVSGSKLEYVKVVALFYDKNNTYIASAWGYTKITTIMPYQTSPFKLSWLGANPLAKHAQIKILDRQDNEIRACSLK